MDNFPGPEKLWNGKRLRIAVLTALFLTAVGYLFLSGMKDSMVYYLTLEELARRPPGAGDGIRLAGRVKEGTISGSYIEGGITFVITDGIRELSVHYNGQIPDTFGDQTEVVVEGIFRQQPVFEAATILAKCPSKYEASEPAPVPGDKR